MSNTTIRSELFKSSIILSCAILVIFGFLLSIILYYSGMSNADAVIRQRNQAVNFFIRGYFTKIHNAVQFLASNKKVRNALSLDQNGRLDILKLYKELEAIDPDINYVYSGYRNGLLLINNYTPPNGYNPVVRPWYQAAIKSAPNISAGLPYREIKTKEWLVSISKILIDDENKTSGVVAIDCSIDAVSDLLRKAAGKYKSSYSFVVRPDGKILIHRNSSMLGKNISAIFHSPVKLSRQTGELVYKLSISDSDKLAYYSWIDNIKWVVVTVVDKAEVIKPILMQIFTSILVIGIVAILLAWFLSASLSNRIVEPLLELRCRVKDIIEGNYEHCSDYKYPDNEIGAIAKDIETLTENELYNRNIELQTINRKLQLLATTDELTKLMNRRKMQDELKKEWDRAARYERRFSIIIFDIDWFKRVNDVYGHQAGDSVLVELAKLAKESIRSTDIICRWGGEEFLILCPETNIDGAKELAIKLCSVVEDHQFTVNSKITISLGVCEFSGQKSLEDMIRQADDKLYEAKQRGKNTVVY